MHLLLVSNKDMLSWLGTADAKLIQTLFSQFVSHFQVAGPISRHYRAV